MKKTFFCFPILCCFVIFMPSCKKDSSSVGSISTIQITLKVGEEYTYDLGGFGFEEGASIIQQASHFDSSFLIRQLNHTKIIYKYQPIQGYIGTDRVKLKSERGSDGASENNKITFTILEFTITK